MVAGSSSCSCAVCGAVCTGRFAGCPEVWERGPVHAKLDGRRLSIQDRSLGRVVAEATRPTTAGGSHDSVGKAEFEALLIEVKHLKSELTHLRAQLNAQAAHVDALLAHMPITSGANGSGEPQMRFDSLRAAVLERLKAPRDGNGNGHVAGSSNGNGVEHAQPEAASAGRPLSVTDRLARFRREA
jgi:hypothetical protein